MITFKELGNLGRRGNQMFQAATTIALALRNNDDYRFPFCDLTGTTNIPIEKFSNNIIFSKSYQEPYFHYKEIPYSPNLNLGGSYFQSYKYFEDYKQEIVNLFMPIPHFEREDGLMAIHCRRRRLS